MNDKEYVMNDADWPSDLMSMTIDQSLVTMLTEPARPGVVLRLD